jgi:hypothetical protein
MRPFSLAVLLCIASTAVHAQEAPAPAETGAPQPGELVRVTLADGQVLRGTLVKQEPERLYLTVAGAGEVVLPHGSVRALERESGAKTQADGELWFQDRSRTRYLYAPSAFMLRRGEGYFSQKELLFSSVAYGLTDHLTVLAGSAVPALFIPEGEGLNFIGGLKVGGALSETLHLAAGAEMLVLPALPDGGGAIGFLFGAATYGTPDLHATLSVGRPVVMGEGDMNDLPFIVVPSGSWRMSRRFALVSENWLLPFQGEEDFSMINALALRFLGEQWSADVGLIRSPEVPVPLPWLDFTYHFGSPR